MPAPPCACEDRVGYGVFADLNFTVRHADGTCNASEVGDVGLGATVSADLLAYAAIGIEDSAWHGWFRDWEIVAAYPVSQWMPPEGEEPGYWQRVRTGTKTWTREHTGETVIPTDDAKTYTDDYAEEGLDLDEDEMIIPGHTDDPEDFGTDYLDLTQSTITAADEVDAAALVAWCQANLGDWGDWNTGAHQDFKDLSIGLCGGVLLEGGYGEDDRPWRAAVQDGRWAPAAIHATDPLPDFDGVGSPWVASPGLTLHMHTRKGYALYSEDPPESHLIGVIDQSMAWRPEKGYWSAAADLADPDSAGWAEIGIAGGSPGRVEWLDPHTWGLDVGLMLRR